MVSAAEVNKTRWPCAGLVSEGGGGVGFAEAYAAKKDEVLFFFDEVGSEGVLDLLAVDGFGSVTNGFGFHQKRERANRPIM